MAIRQPRPFVLVDSDAGRMSQLFRRNAPPSPETDSRPRVQRRPAPTRRGVSPLRDSACPSSRQASTWLRQALAIAVVLGLGLSRAHAAPPAPQQQVSPAITAPAAVQQQQIPPPDGMGGMPGPHADKGMQSSITPQMQHRMADRRNDERQKALVADTEKLLALAQQLKAEVDKTDKDQLSVHVVKRAEQIEKLAHSVKEKMRGY